MSASHAVAPAPGFASIGTPQAAPDAGLDLHDQSGLHTKTALPASVSIVIPTLNERENVSLVVERLRAVLTDIAWEVVFVDDNSTDGTWKAVRAMARQDARVRCIRRIGRRGLSTACIEGILATSAPFIVIMDGDLQHDETVLPRMLETLQSQDCDLVVASRYVDQGGIGDWSEGRARISRVATRLAALVNKSAIKDPMSGFFALRREVFDANVEQLSGQGFKLLLDICASARTPLRVIEVPTGSSLAKTGRASSMRWSRGSSSCSSWTSCSAESIPPRFILFIMVGGSGVFVHMLALWTLMQGFDVGFAVAQTAASFVAMTSNFFLNNLLTYRDKRLRGGRLVKGLLSFYIVCGIGTAANVGASSFIFGNSNSWWFAGLAGVVIASVWNYAVSSIMTWGNRS